MKAIKQNNDGVVIHKTLKGDIWYCPKCHFVVKHENDPQGMTYQYDECPKCHTVIEYEEK